MGNGNSAESRVSRLEHELLALWEERRRREASIESSLKIPVTMAAVFLGAGLLSGSMGFWIAAFISSLFAHPLELIALVLMAVILISPVLALRKWCIRHHSRKLARAKMQELAWIEERIFEKQQELVRARGTCARKWSY